MKFDVMTVGKIKPGFFQDGEKEYLKRLQRYTRISCTIIKSGKLTHSINDLIVKNKEAERFFDKFSPDDFIVALDQRGKQFSSEQLAEKLQNWQINNVRRVVFVIGGAVGLSEKILKKADIILSMSKMTFQHDMAKLILLEQLYRSFTILHGEKYHK